MLWLSGGADKNAFLSGDELNSRGMDLLSVVT